MKYKWSDGDAYERYVGRWSRRVGEDFLSWLQIDEEMCWLDLGSGTGALTSRVLNNWNPKSVVGVEPSKDFVAIAQEEITDRRSRFIEGTGERIPLDDGTVDVAVSGLVLNFIPDQEMAMAELMRVVRPGGTVAGYVWDYAGHVQFMRYFWDAACELDPSAQEKDEGIRFPICRPGPLRQLFEGAGLRDVKTAAMDIPTPFADFDDYWTPFLSGIAPAPGYCASLSEANREKLRARLAASLPTDQDGMILLAARAWAVQGIRT